MTKPSPTTTPVLVSAECIEETVTLMAERLTPKARRKVIAILQGRAGRAWGHNVFSLNDARAGRRGEPPVTGALMARQQTYASLAAMVEEAGFHG